MRIQKKRIQNPQRYLNALNPGDEFYIATPLAHDNLQKLRLYGIEPDSPARIPIPHRSATEFNANGRWILLKDLPKEVRTFEHEYHVVDWHGKDHYGICWQDRWCYQREYIPPTDLAFVVENGVLYSPLLHNNDDNLAVIKAAMNVVLEMVGYFEVWTVEKAPAIPPVKQTEVPWEILRAGTKMPSAWEAYIKKVVTRKPKTQQTIIRKRHEHLWKMNPDFCVLGTQNFWGYVVYGFSHLSLYVFECNEVNNATYVFKGDWENASKLTKSEVLFGNLHEARIYHRENWYNSVKLLLSRNGKRDA